MDLLLDPATERHSYRYTDEVTEYSISGNIAGENVNDLNMWEFSKQLDELCCVPILQPAQEPSTHVPVSTPEVQQTVHPVLMPELQPTVQPVLMQEPAPEQARADFHVNSPIFTPQPPSTLPDVVYQSSPGASEPAEVHNIYQTPFSQLSPFLNDTNNGPYTKTLNPTAASSMAPISFIEQSTVIQDVVNIPTATGITLTQPSVPIISSIQPPPVGHAVGRQPRRLAPKPASTDDLNRSLISSRQQVPAACDVATTGRPAARTSKPYVRFNKATLQSLNAWFDSNRDHPYPDVFTRHRLEKEGNLTATQVKSWFNNRRKKAKKESSPASSTAANFRVHDSKSDTQEKESSPSTA